MSRIWITGENSCIANSFAEFCSASNKHKIVNSMSNDEYNYWRKTSPERSNEIDIFDPTLENLISNANVDFIIHTAEKKYGKDDSILETNVIGSYYISQIAKNLEIPIIYFSSLYEEEKIYSFSKRSGIELVKMNNNFCFINHSIIYGSHHDSIINEMIRSHYTSKIIKLYMKDRSFIYSDDFNNIILEVIENYNSYKNKTVYATKDENYSLDALIGMMNECGIIPNYDALKPSTKEGNNIYSCSSSLINRPKVGLGEGIERTIRWMERNGKE